MATGGLYGSTATAVPVTSDTDGLYGSGSFYGGTFFEWFIFQQSNTQPTTPTGGTWSFTTSTGTPPTGWSNTPPSNPTGLVWVSIAFINSITTTYNWSTPALWFEQGTAGQVAVGTTTTLSAGSPATVSNSGTAYNAILNFGIPQGIQGATGATGPTGPTGPTGATGTAATIAVGTTTTLAYGSPATVTNSGSSSAATFNFGIPQGIPGTAATIAVGTTTTTAPGTAATVTNSGTSSAAVFNFGIPKGAGVAPGGTTGQALVKNSNADYDTTWSTITGVLSYQGTWNANTNTPTLTSSVGTNGYYYIVSVGGTTNLNGITDWQPNDWAIFNGTSWEKIDNSDLVTSVNGYTGAVVLTNTDVGAPTYTGTGASGTWGINVTGNAGTVTNGVYTTGSYSNPSWITNLAGSKVTAIPNSSLTNSTISGVSLGSNLNALTIGTGLSGTSYNGSSAVTITNTLPMVYPSAGIPNSTGSAWGTSYSTSGTGTVVALATGASLTNAKFISPTNFTPTTAPTYAQGNVWYDSTFNGLAYQTDISGVTIYPGQEVATEVYNQTGSTIAAGAVVYITGQHSNQPTVVLAQANSLTTSNAIGVVQTSIANNSNGWVTILGEVQSLNTSGFSAGDTLYLSATTPGAITNVAPTSPNYAVRIGFCTYSNPANGNIFVSVRNVYVNTNNMIGQVPVANGGTGASTLTGYVYGNGTSAMTASTTIPTTALSGTITNAQLANSAITINGTPTSLGGSISVGTVTSASVVSANGFAGTVANASTTPAITLTTTITGLLKGNGTAISAATSGTDYAPATSGSAILYGNGAGGFSSVTIGSGVSFSGGTLSATGTGGTVTSVSGTGSVNGITLTGTVTSSGSLTLGGTLGSIANTQLVNSSITFGATAYALGSTVSNINGVSIGGGTF